MSFIDRISQAIKQSTQPQRNWAVPLAIILSFTVIGIGYLVYGSVQRALAQTEWYDSLWLYKQKITISSDRVVVDETNLILTVIIPAGNSVFTNAQASGNDIVFVADDHITRLDHEMEIFDPDPVSEIGIFRVKVPLVSSTSDTGIYMYYGNPDVANQENPAGVYGAEYGIFYEMGLDGQDSTINGRHRVADVDSPLADDTVLGLGVAFNGRSAWSLENMAYWEQEWNIRTHNVIFETGDDVISRQTILAEGETSDGMMLYILDSKLYARWWSESQGWQDVEEAEQDDQGGGNHLVTTEGFISPNTVYYATMTFEYIDGISGAYRLFVNGAEQDIDLINHVPPVVISAHGGDGGVAYTGISSKDYHDLEDSQGGYFIGTIAQLEVLDEAWTDYKHVIWYNMLSDNGSFLTFGSEEIEVVPNPREGFYYSPNISIYDDPGAYITSLDVFWEISDIDVNDSEFNPETDDINDFSRIEFAVKFFDGANPPNPLGYGDSGEDGFFILSNELIDELNNLIWLDEIRQMQFRIFMVTVDNNKYIPWVETVALSYAVRTEAGEAMGIINFDDTNNQSVKQGKSAIYPVTLTPLSAYKDIQQVQLNIVIAEMVIIDEHPVDVKGITAEPVIIDFNGSASYPIDITIVTTDNATIATIPFYISVVVIDPDRPDLYAEPDPLIGYITVTESDIPNVSISFVSPQEGDIWYYEEAREISIDGSFSSNIVDPFCITFFVGIKTPPMFIRLFTDNGGLISCDVEINLGDYPDGQFQFSIAWESVGYIDGTEIFSEQNLINNVYIMAQVSEIEAWDGSTNDYESGIFSIMEEGDDQYPAITLEVTVPVEGDKSADQPVFTIRLYHANETDASNYVFEEGSITPDNFTSGDQVDINVPEGYVQNGSEYIGYVRTNRHLWSKAIDPAAGKILIDIDGSEHPNYTLVFPKLTIGDIAPIDRDDQINSLDYTELTSNFWSIVIGILPDLNNDGEVNGIDATYLFGNWWKESELPG